MTDNQSQLKIALVGAGLIGVRHAKLLSKMKDFSLCAIIDPSEASGNLATELRTVRMDDLQSFLDSDLDCDGVVAATPNDTHLTIALTCIENGLPCLIEKPLAANSEDAKEIYTASQKSEIPVLVGHHRRHHLASQKMRDFLNDGIIGNIVGAQLTWALRKPNEYFSEGKWRTQKGGGPVWINLIHEIDLLRYFLGEIKEVSAMLSNAVRANAVEDTGVINLRFESGALASAMVSDCSPSPWHFEGASGENPNIAETGLGGLRVFGTRGAIEFPSLTVWKHENEDGHWGTPINESVLAQQGTLGGETALTLQLEHFAEVIRGKAQPLVSAADGLQSVRVVEAIHRSASSISAVPVESG